MKVELNVTLEGLEDKINRQIIVNDNISLIDLCEYIIISMNGNKIPIYNLDYNETTYFPDKIYELDDQKSLQNITLKDLKIKKGSELWIEYNFDKFYHLNVIIDNIYENTNDKDKSDFKVISGKGYGILDNIDIIRLKTLLTYKRKDIEKYYTKEEKEYLQKTFDISENNTKIKEYIEFRKEINIPKRYIFNVTLNEFDKEIKRKISVNSNILIDSFCRKVVTSMNGDLSHEYGIKIDKEYISEYYDEIELYYLALKEKKRLKIIYDWGDNWIFNLTVSKVIADYSENDFEVLSGKGYGIIDDCGGTYGLNNIFNGNDNSWGEYDINNFNLEKCNEIVKKSM